MNQSPTEKDVDGVLEIISKEDSSKVLAKINVFKIEDNLWKYVRNNGQSLHKRSNIDPNDLADSIRLIYFIKYGIKVNTKYIPDHIHQMWKKQHGERWKSLIILRI